MMRNIVKYESLIFALLTSILIVGFPPEREETKLSGKDFLIRVSSIRLYWK